MDISIKVTYKSEGLQKLRKAASGLLRQSQLADLAGIKVQVLQQYERGARDINGAKLPTLLKICNALECRLADIITDEETLPESPMAHVLKKRLEKAEIMPMLSSRNPWSEKEIEGKKFAFTEEVPGLVDFIGGVWIVAPQGGVTKTLRFEFAPEKSKSRFRAG